MALVQSNAGAQSTNLATVSATWSSAATAGNVIVIGVSAGATITTPAGWTLSPGCSQVDYNAHYIWWKIAAGGETSQSYTLGSAEKSAWWTAEISGLTASPYDVSTGTFHDGGGAQTLTTEVTLSITPTTGSRYVVASIGGLTTGTTRVTLASWLNSFTEQQDSGTAGTSEVEVCGLADQAVTGNGATTFSSGATFSRGMSGTTGIIIAFKVSAASAFVAEPAIIIRQAIKRASYY